MLAVDRRRLPAGTEIGGGRHILSLLGGGDRYEAYVAWDPILHAPVVAKVLRPHLLDDERARRAMLREADALATLAHPDLVRGFAAELGGAHPHLVLEYLDGPRLSTLVRRFGTLSAEQLVLLARRVAGVLAYLDTVGWVHLDVKPRNLVMTATPRLIDLSVARPIEAARGRSGIGTTATMAPEQADPARAASVGPASDVWGLAATLHEAVSGQQPFPHGPIDEDGAVRRPPVLPDRVPAAMAELIGRCLAPVPSDRPSAATLVAELDPLVDWAARSARRLR